MNGLETKAPKSKETGHQTTASAADLKEASSSWSLWVWGLLVSACVTTIYLLCAYFLRWFPFRKAAPKEPALPAHGDVPPQHANSSKKPHAEPADPAYSEMVF